MKIIIDSNILFGDWHLRSPDFQTLFEGAHRAGWKIFLPEVVKDEVIENYNIQMTSHFKNYNNALKKIVRLQGHDVELESKRQIE